MVNKAGSSFEVSCFQAVADRYGLLSREGQLLPREGPAGDIRVLRNVRLARSNEVDMMVVRILRPSDPLCDPLADPPSCGGENGSEAATSADESDPPPPTPTDPPLDGTRGAATTRADNADRRIEPAGSRSDA
eukprot:810943-Prorocentrum_minimum.AAC.1